MIPPADVERYAKILYATQFPNGSGWDKLSESGKRGYLEDASAVALAARRDTFEEAESALKKKMIGGASYNEIVRSCIFTIRSILERQVKL